MKILKKLIDDDKNGIMKLLVENEEDVWHLFNVIYEGDRISSKTFLVKAKKIKIILKSLE